jgi:hypothetical protein
VSKITPPEDKETPEIAASKSPYDHAYAFVQECIARRRGDLDSYGPLEDYERPVAIKISEEDWIKLRSNLNLEESDDA